MTTIVKSNVYRCTEFCSNCPFIDNGKKIGLRVKRIPELEQYLLTERESSFNCHKTVYALDNEMNPTEHQDLKMCYGAWLLKRKHHVYNIQMRLAISMGIDPIPKEDNNEV